MINAPFFQQLIDAIGERGRELLRLSGRSEDRAAQDICALCEELLSRRGEASGVALAGDVLNRYSELDDDAKLAFFRFLAAELNADRDAVLTAADGYRDDPSPLTLMTLHLAAEPRRQELLRRLNRAPDGTSRLVKMRSDLLDLSAGNAELKAIDTDFFHLFSSWFNRGFLVLRRFDWNTSAAVLEKVIAYEAVHQISNWDALRRRLAPDRRCFGFFHPALVDEPLIFVEVALVKSIATRIQPLIDSREQQGDPAGADTAVFYSISNCQRGLRGVSFGNFLIKQVAAELLNEMPQLKNLVTLSPMPGFMHWLNAERQAEYSAALDDAQRERLAALDEPEWHADEERRAELEPELLALAAYYFLQAKTPDGKPLDPVARFHLGNGARLEQINPSADLFEKGLRESAGLMVNYAYVLSDIEKNHEAYANNDTVVTTPAVRKLLRSDAKNKPLATAEER